jgi:hypothetical protein
MFGGHVISGKSNAFAIEAAPCHDDLIQFLSSGTSEISKDHGCKFDVKHKLRPDFSIKASILKSTQFRVLI